MVDLSGSTGPLRVEWFNPATGETLRGDTVPGRDRKTFTIPFKEDAVLYLTVRGPHSTAPLPASAQNN
jgi:hypothetical protein